MTIDPALFGPLCLGGNVFGWTLDQDGSYAVLDAFRARGGRFIDTADIYAMSYAAERGGSEGIIGAWLADRGLADTDELVIATKVGMQMRDGSGLAPQWVQDSAERSRELLGVEAIDVYYAHQPDPQTPLLESLVAFHELVQRGVVRSIGLSNFDAAQLREALELCDEHGLERPVLLQPHYNLLTRDRYEGELAQLCVDEEIAVAPYYALAAGFLTGKYQPGEPAPDSPRARSVLDRYGNDRGWELLARVEQVAQRHGATPTQVAIAWLRTRPGIVAPIASATSPEHVDELFGATELTLTSEDLELLA